LGDWVKVNGKWVQPVELSHCQLCLPTEDDEDWSVKPGYVPCFTDGKPDFFPASIPAPMAYYYLAEGGGYDLT